MTRDSAVLRDPEFLKLWVGQSISMTGSQVSLLALPLIAAVLLDAGPVQMGVLRALDFAPVLLIGLPAGAWLDTVRRRPVMIAADLGQAVLLAAVPLAAVLGALRLESLYAVAFLTGSLSLLFEIANSAWLPGLVDSRHLLDANSKLEVSRWTIRVTGPGLAGAMIQLVGAPFAMVADAISFVVSAMLLCRIHLPETPASRGGQPGNIWRDMLAGLRVLAHEPVLRAMAITGAVSNLFAYIQAAVLVLYVTRDLGLAPSAYGLILSGFGLGGVCGALVGPRVAGRVGYGGAIACGVALMASGNALVALAGAPLALAGLVAGQVLTGFGLPLCTISMISLRQSITPRDLLGRVNATTRLVSWGALPLGALLGGALGEAIGIRPTLVLSSAGSAMVVLWVLLALTPATRKLAVRSMPA
jgi:MFS family permease